MDYLKKQLDIIDSKKLIVDKEVEQVEYFIVYFMHDRDIVYIGKTSNVFEYVHERKDKYSATHYNTEKVSIDNADNYLAEMILNIKPIHNKNIPKNTKYISNNQAKDKYFIHKPDFRKVFNEHGGVQYKSLLYIEKQIFDDIFAKEPYHEDMPKIGRRVNLVSDIDKAPICLHWGNEFRFLKDEEGNDVEALVDAKPDWKQNYKNMTYLQENEYEVINLIDTETFEAVCISNGTKKTFRATDGLWNKCIDECTIASINRKYLELAKAEEALC